jgi:hypothetical protein
MGYCKGPCDQCRIATMASPPLEQSATDCYLGLCAQCETVDHIQNHLEDSFEKNCIESLTFQRWITNNHCKLETIVKSVKSATKFIEKFVTDLGKLRKHDLITKK